MEIIFDREVIEIENAWMSRILYERKRKQGWTQHPSQAKMILSLLLTNHKHIKHILLIGKQRWCDNNKERLVGWYCFFRSLRSVIRLMRSHGLLFRSFPSVYVFFPLLSARKNRFTLPILSDDCLEWTLCQHWSYLFE